MVRLTLLTALVLSLGCGRNQTPVRRPEPAPSSTTSVRQSCPLTVRLTDGKWIPWLDQKVGDVVTAVRFNNVDVLDQNQPEGWTVVAPPVVEDLSAGDWQRTRWSVRGRTAAGTLKTVAYVTHDIDFPGLKNER